MLNVESRRGVAIASFICGTALVGVSHAGIVEDFESYGLGSFPSPFWQDVGLIDVLPPNPPDPSAIVIDATDAFGNPTQVLSTLDALAPSQGIYHSIDVTDQYFVSADVRIDRFCDVPVSETTDWAMEVGVGQFLTDVDPSITPQVGIYASSFTAGWRLYVVGTDVAFLDIDLGLPVDLGRWYSVEMDLDAVNGVVTGRIFDTLTGDLLVDQTDVIPDWTPAEGLYDMVNFFDGELSVDNTVSNLAVIDNIYFVPAPSSIVLLAAGPLITRRRRPTA